jgi:two-component system chemotaxis response regulator CheB
MINKKVKVLVVDDSTLICAVLSEIINQSPDCEVVGTARDAYAAKALVQQQQPDVITLDINMPKVSGLVFLDKLMQAQPTPVIMVSTLTREGAPETLRALELGAVDFIEKPKSAISQGLHNYADTLIEKIKIASRARVFPKNRTPVTAAPPIPPIAPSQPGLEQAMVGIGASTGGTEAIRQIVENLPAQFPPVLITQHMPAGFTQTFAQRLNSLSKLTVKEAQQGEVVAANYVYIAPGNLHMTIQPSSLGYTIKLLDTGTVSGHQPSVDVMFDSLATHVKRHCVATLLTGMGKDGAAGLLAIKRSGGVTYAQDQATSTVYGMPKAALDVGATTQAIPIDMMAAKISGSVRLLR